MTERKREWNKHIEDTVIQIGESAKRYKIIHLKAARKAMKWYTILMVFGIVVGPSAGTLSAIGTALNPEKDPTIPIISCVLGFISGIVVAGIKFAKLDEVSLSNKTTAAKYTSIESNVRRQMALQEEDRVPAKSYLEWLGKCYDELYASAPLLNSSMYKEEKDVTKYDKVIQVCPTYVDEQIQNVANTTKIKAVTISPKTQKREIPGDSTNKKFSRVFTTNNDIRIVIDDPEPEEKISINRTSTLANFSDLNKYSDGKMRYEIGRMFGFN